MTQFTVCYVYRLGVGCDHHTKHTFKTIEEAQSKMDYLANLSIEQLKNEEGIDPPPFLFRILQITTPKEEQ